MPEGHDPEMIVKSQVFTALNLLIDEHWFRVALAGHDSATDVQTGEHGTSVWCATVY